jgi:2-amino-4-hydroxy-6-hydroxymethyldihydropteridine diphosphokinase
MKRKRKAMRRNDGSDVGSTVSPQVVSKAEVIVALGSNLGNRNDYLDEAICALETLIGPVQVSSRWVSAPVTEADADEAVGEQKLQDQYVNMVLIGSTELSPLQLLAETQKIEVTLGRPAQHGFHTPRTIDIDLIAIDEVQLVSETLTLPHEEAVNRLFVLLPLAELRPDYCFARQKQSIAQLIAQAPQIAISLQNTVAD